MNAKTKSIWTVTCLAVAALVTAVAPTAHADEPVASPEGVVNINTATPEQLGLLSGIGATKARAIVEHRQRRPFARVDDLVAVRGIGRATLRRLRPYLVVRGETTLSRPVARPRADTAAERPAGGQRAAATSTRPPVAARR
jgi:competence protein ComEA